MRPNARFNCLLSSLAALVATCQASIELRLVVWDGDDGLKVIRTAVSQFEAAHPGVKVKLENVPYGQYATKLLAQVAGNAAPDVAMMEPKMFQAFAKQGAAQPLRGLDQHLVAGVMTKRVVHLFEPVEIDHRNSHGPLGEPLLQGCGEVRAVRKPGELVVEGLMFALCRLVAEPVEALT